MARRLTITIPDFVPDARLGLNGRKRTHWHTVSALSKDAGLRMLLTLQSMRFKGQLPTPFEVIERAHITAEFVYPVQRRRDPDNLAGAWKPLGDILVREGILFEDDCAHIELTLRAVVEPGVTETRIVVEEVDA
jgi:hypothetical protein